MSQRGSKVSKRVARSGNKGSEGGTTKIAKKAKTGRMKKRKKGGKTGKAKPSKKDLELEAITPFARGLSIGVKFAGLTACVVGLFMGLLGWLTYSISARNIDDQITEQGVSIVSTLEKAVTRRFWVGQMDRVPKKGQKFTPPPPQSRAQLIADWESRLKGMVEESDGKISAVVIVNKPEGGGTQQVGVAQYPSKRFSIDQNPIGTEGEIKIFEGMFQGKRVRRFDKAIPLDNLARDREVTKQLEALRGNDPKSEDFHKALTKLQGLTGEKKLRSLGEWNDWRQFVSPPLFLHDEAKNYKPWVSVFVRASRLDDVKAEMKSRIGVVTFCGAIAGILLTVLISAVLTGPIRELETDISEVAGGNLQHQSRVRSKDEIGGLAHVFNIMTRNLKTAQTNAVERQAMERELNIAKEIQEKLLPERIPQIPGIDIHSHYNAAKEVGGDYYDFIVIDQTHLGIIVADVAGKGIPGAMVMTMARSLVRLAAVRNVSPADTFKKVNRILAKDIRRGMFVTAAYIVLNVKKKTLRAASAGHNPIVLFRAKTGDIELVKPKGIALGFDKGTIFDNNIKEVEVQLEPGDRIVTYTDGVNEAMNNDSEEFGDERFYDLTKAHARKSSKEFVEAVVAALNEHRGNAEQSDDITITTLSVQGDA